MMFVVGQTDNMGGRQERWDGDVARFSPKCHVTLIHQTPYSGAQRKKQALSDLDTYTPPSNSRKPGEGACSRHLHSHHLRSSDSVLVSPAGRQGILNPLAGKGPDVESSERKSTQQTDTRRTAHVTLQHLPSVLYTPSHHSLPPPEVHSWPQTLSQPLANH
jgi:hypothetical protein